MARFDANYIIIENNDSIASQTSTTTTIVDNVAPDDGSFDSDEEWFVDVSGGIGPTVGSFSGTISVNSETFYVFVNGTTITYLGMVSDPTSFSVDEQELENAVTTTFDSNPRPVCFAAGTLIATPEGEIAVEKLNIGDAILTMAGAKQVKWIGRQTLSKQFTNPERFVPVRVKASALSEGVPSTDLLLTCDHALIINDMAINASALVNNSSIHWGPIDNLPDLITYFHVETDEHDVIFANGAPAESYIDYISRQKFDNYQEYVDLYGEEITIQEMNRIRISSARMLPPSIRERLLGKDRAA